jgi:alpha-beta hydrolase superfamily lysophospholipase
MHPHVAGKLFWDHGYDLYVLNYKHNGCCRKRGWVTNPFFNSHNKSGNFDVYNSDIMKSLEIVNASGEYETLLGYAHSTGAPILTNYLMEYGDTAFDGFIFNSPFLDWGFVGGDMVEFALKRMSLLQKVTFGHLPNDTMMGIVPTPDELKGTPIRYLDHDVVPSDWSARIWSLYYFDWGSRPLYNVPMTVGFAKGVTAIHLKLEKLHRKKRVVTLKPLLVITSRGDDVLKAPETLTRADWIGSNRCEVELDNNGHDVFLSQDKDDVDMAVDMVAAWMKNQKFTLKS